MRKLHGIVIALLLLTVSALGQGSKTPINNGILQSDLNAAGYKILNANLSDYAGTGLTWNTITGKFDASGGGAGSPGGSNQQFQYNNAGSFGGIPALKYDGTIPLTGTLTPGAAITLPAIRLQNPTVATAGTGGQQYSPSIELSGHGYLTGAGDHTYKWGMFTQSFDQNMQPVSASLPYSWLKIGFAYDGGAYDSHGLIIDSRGNMFNANDGICAFAEMQALDTLYVGNPPNKIALSNFHPQGGLIFSGGLGATGRIVWTNGGTISDTVDVSIGRDAVNVLGIYTIGNANTYADLKVRNIALQSSGAITGNGAVPTGGTTGQVLAKNTNTNYDVGWTAAGGGAVSLTATSPVIVTPSPITGTGVISLTVGSTGGVEAWDTDLDTWATKTPYAGAVTITTGKTFNCTGNLTLAGTDGSTLNMGTGGTLGTAAYTASTAYQVADADLTTWAGITPVAAVGTWIATPSSANLRSAMTDENGTGALLFSGATTPDFTTGITVGAAAASGKMLQGDGTKYAGSTATWPTTNTVGYLVRGDGTNYAAFPSQIINSSTASQSPTTTEVYLTGSNCTVAAGDFKAKGQYRCTFDMTKSAGTGAIVIAVKVGTLGTTSDTTQLTFTFGAGTSVADTGTFEVIATWRTVGSGTSAVLVGMCRCVHNLATTGLINNAAGWVIAGTVSSGFASNTATQIGCTFNGSTSFAGTTTLVQASLQQ